MAGSHRAPRAKERPRVSGRAAAVVVAVSMVPLVWFAVDRVRDDSAEPADRGALGTPTPSVSATVAAEPTRSARPTTATKPALPRLAPAVPRRLASGTLLDVGFDDSIEPRNGSFRAASTGEVTRWGSRGLPGSPGTDTVYIIGKAYAGGDSAFAALPKVRVGNKITIRTDRGRVTYTVTSARNRPTRALATKDDFAAKVPGRLVLVGIRYSAAGDAIGQAYVVVAQLSAVRPS